MHGRWRLLGLAVLLAVVGVLSIVTAAQAAAPWVILVTGPGLTRPAILANWSDNQELVFGSSVTLDPAELTTRPYLDLALFWGPEWEQYVSTGKSLANLRPEQ